MNSGLEDDAPEEEKTRLSPMELRHNARVAAAQALYQLDIIGAPVKSVVFEFLNHRFGHEDEPGYMQADEAFFEAIVFGVVEDQASVDALISERLSEKWKLSRLDRTLRAILRSAVWELSRRDDVPAKSVIDEYVRLTTRFFDAKEAGFVNAILDRLARDVRTVEMTPTNPA